MYRVSHSIAWLPISLLTPLSSIIGSGLGGTLSDPVRNYPGVFVPGTLWEKYPYLLPNLVCVGFVVFGLVVGFLFLEETHEDKKYRKDPGNRLGRWILRRLSCTNRSCKITDKDEGLEETISFLADEENVSGYDSTASAEDERPKAAHSRSLRPTVRQTFTLQVVLNIVGYGILAL